MYALAFSKCGCVQPILQDEIVAVSFPCVLLIVCSDDDRAGVVGMSLHVTSRFEVWEGGFVSSVVKSLTIP